jgi:carboxynorspermidine decarboxylase
MNSDSRQQTIACDNEKLYLDIVQSQELSTPAFIVDESVLLQSGRGLAKMAQGNNIKLLLSLKSFATDDYLRLMAQLVEGFSASSLFEASLVREVVGDNGKVHITTPGLKPDEIGQIAELSDYIAFNSLSQWGLFKDAVKGQVNCGLRVNPQLSIVKDSRYDPCRRHSKLGVPIDQLKTALSQNSTCLEGIHGIHFHTNCDSVDGAALLATVRGIEKKLDPLLYRLEWMNMGGGYLLEKLEKYDDFCEAIRILQSKYDLEVFVEPGAAFVREAGFLVSTVLDLFSSDGKKVAILDTTVNHMPEVFEYQFEPDVAGHVDEGRNSYILAGCTCLAGDVFGEYSFETPLEIGSRVVFSNVGAYTLVKANMFNGINLPTIYTYTQDGKLKVNKQFSYEDFKSRCGVNNYAIT